MKRFLRFSVHQLVPLTIALGLFLSFTRGQCSDSAFKTYYDELFKQSGAPPSSQIQSFKSFIIEHPDFAPAYLDLVERAAEANQSAKAELFLRKMIYVSSPSAPARWALAHIYEKKVMPDSAFSEFLNAFNAGMNSFEFYNDFLRFDMENNYRFSVLLLIQKSNAPSAQKKFCKALALYHKGSYVESNTLLQSLNVPEEEKIVQYFKACNEFYLQNISECEIAVNKALASAKSQGDLKSEAVLLNFLFPIYWASDGSKARDFLRQANDIAKAICDKHLQARISLSQSYLLGVDVNQKEAAKGYLNAAAVFTSFRDYRRAARAFSNASDALYTVSRYSQALDAVLQSLALYDKIDDHIETIEALTTIAKIYSKLDQHKISLNYLKQARRIAEAYGYPKQLAEIHANQQKILATTVSVKNAVSIYKQLIAESKTKGTSVNAGYCYCMCGFAYIKLHDTKKARQCFLQAIRWAKENSNPYIGAWALSGIVRLKNIKHEDISDKDFENLLDYSRRVADRRLESSTFYELGEYYKNQNRFDKAIESYKRAIQINESMRDSLKADTFRMGLMSDQLSSYKRLSEIYAALYQQQHNPDFIADAFQYEEMHHARSLKDEFQRKIKTAGESLKLSPNYQNAVDKLRKKQLDIRRLKSAAVPDSVLQKLLAQHTAFKYNLLTEKIEYAQKLPDTLASQQYAPITLPQLQESLHEQTVIIYHLHETGGYALAINSDSVDVIQLAVDSRSIKDAIELLIAPMHNVVDATIAETPFFAQQAYQLYVHLFQPIEQQFPLHRQVFILSQEELALLPFELLLRKNPPNPVYTPLDAPVYSNDFLVNDYTFSYGPSTIELLHPIQRDRRPKILVLANPFADEPETANEFTLRFRTGWRFDNLPYARMEALKIKNQFRSAKVKLGHSATEHYFKTEAHKFDIIHIATHAFADLDFETFSGLALAMDSDSTEDGLLQGYEITDNSLSCDLVVLSACETGRGKAVSGEGVLALPRQFLLAGTRSVIMSQWKVDDRFTALMMPLFYRNYLYSTMNKAAALRQAKIQILEKQEQYQNIHYQHPFFWASFTFYGESGQTHPPYHSVSIGRFLAGFAIVSALGLILFVAVWRHKKVRNIVRT